MRVRDIIWIIIVVLNLYSCSSKNNVIKKISQLQKQSGNDYDYDQYRLMLYFSDKYPDDTLYTKQLALYYTDIRNFDAAYECYSKLIKSNPSHKEALCCRAEVSLLNDHINLALEDISKTIELFPHDSVLKGVKKYYQVIQLTSFKISKCDSLINIDPLNPDYFFVRGKNYFSINQFKYAISDFSQAISLNSTKPDYYIYKAESYYNMDSIGKTIEIVQEALIHNHSHQLEMYLNNLKVEKNEIPTIKKYTELISKNPKNSDAYEQRSKSYTKCSRYEKALIDINKAISLNKNSFHLLNARIIIYWKMQDYENARKDLELLIKSGGKANEKLVSAVKRKSPVL